MDARRPSPSAGAPAHWGLVLARAAALVALYVAAGWAGWQFDRVQDNARVLYPQAGIALGALLLLGWAYWPAVLAASVVFSTVASVQPWVQTAGIALSNTLGAAAAAYLLLVPFRFDRRLRSVRDAAALVVCGVLLGPALAAGGAVATAIASQPQLAELPNAWRDYLWPLAWRRWFGQGISNLVLAPLLLAWAQVPEFYLRMRRAAEAEPPPMPPPSSDPHPDTAPAPFPIWPVARLSEWLTLFVLLALVCIAGFGRGGAVRSDLLASVVTYAPFPFVIWAALRLGLRGASTATAVVALIAVWGTADGEGPFVRAQPTLGLLLLQVYLTVVAATGLFLSAAAAERRAAETALWRSRENLRALSARLQTAREEERTMIAREIHDELGQQLTGLKMVIHGAARRLPHDTTAALQRCRQALRQADEAVATVRRIATDLRPGILDDLGVVASIQWLAEEHERRTGTRTVFTGPETDTADLAPDAATALFRIAQEALTNVARHANATRVEVDLRRKGRHYALTITDDGPGLADAAGSGREGLGIVGMRERAQLAGGTLTIDTHQDDAPGVRVTARIPVGAPTGDESSGPFVIEPGRAATAASE